LGAVPPAIMALGQGSDIEEDNPILYSIVSLQQPKTIVELGTRHGISTRAIAAARTLGSCFFTVDPDDCTQYLEGVSCSPIRMTGEDFYRWFTDPIDFLFIDTDPHTYEQTMLWLKTFVEHRLAPGGVVAFHDIHPARPEIQVREAVEMWLQTHKGWAWQVLLPAGQTAVFNGGLGLLWAPPRSQS
jgi:predicted O-methyltransferase YrrM